MHDRLADALKKSTADYCEIRFETDDHTGLALRGEEVDHVSTRKLEGGIVRACTRGGWGRATFDSLDDIDYQVREACEAADLVGRETTRLAEPSGPEGAEIAVSMKRDFRGVGIDEKLALATSYNDILRETDPAVASTRVAYSETFRTVHFASTHGVTYTEERPRVILHLVAIARDGSNIQRAHDGVSSSVDYSVVEGLEEKAEATARRAVDLLDAPPCPGGATTVVLDQELAGVFAHEAFGHLSEADHLYENPQMRELMTLGREMGTPELNIVDDGSEPGLIGFLSYDDEGTPTGRTHLISDGVLAGHLHSLETAAKMDEAPTGNARAIGRGYPPIVRMTNTMILPGEESFEEFIAGIDDGIYACGMQGGQTMMEMFTFSAAHGYRITGGEVGELVRDVTLTGNVFETLHGIDGFADDFEIAQKGGGCGKGGQSPLPVTFGSPHLRIRDVVIGGR